MNRSSSISLRHQSSDAGASPINLTALRRWILGFCIIRFDLEQGQVIEDCYPADVLPVDTLLHVAFSSFPDSTSHHLHISAPAAPAARSSINDSIFFFRLQHHPAQFIYGFVFNRRRQDDRLRRGGEQKSVVILSLNPFSSVFRPLLQILAPLCFDSGPSALSLVASHVAAWPSPSPGLLMHLPMASSSLRAHIPIMDDTPAPSHGLFHDSDLFASFRSHLLHLWTIWELIIIGEPILIIAPTPPQCSEAVAALVSLVSPLLPTVDFRPYFTIHDPDFSSLNSLPDNHSFPPMILGVTNLFFLKALHTIPHVISVGSPGAHSERIASPMAGVAVSSPSVEGARNSQPIRLNLNKFSPTRLLNAVKLRREGPLSLMSGHREALWSTYTPTTKPDTSVLNRLVDAGMTPHVEESMSVVNNDILRRHFLELTTNFLAPFGPYLRASAPLEGSSPFVESPPLPPFNAQEFLLGLAARGPGKFMSKRMRSNWLDLYRRFLMGHTFLPWFRRRRASIEQEQRRMWRSARRDVEIQKLISKMSEVEIVDSFNAIERHLLIEMQLHQSGSGSADSSTVCQKLKVDLQAVFSVLPKDMQHLLLSNPKRACILQNTLEHTKLPGRPAAHPDLVSETTLPFLAT